METAFKTLRKSTGMNIKQFSEYFEIPYSTALKWEGGCRECSPYLLKLMEYKLKKEQKKWIIHTKI